MHMEYCAQEKGYNEFVQTAQCRLQDCHDMYFHVVADSNHGKVLLPFRFCWQKKNTMCLRKKKIWFNMRFLWYPFYILRVEIQYSKVVFLVTMTWVYWFSGIQIGWWFQTWILFSISYRMSSFPLTNSIIFQDGFLTTYHCWSIAISTYFVDCMVPFPGHGQVDVYNFRRRAFGNNVPNGGLSML